MTSDQAHNDYMPKVDLNTDANKLKRTDLIFMKRAEQINLARAQTLAVNKKNNRLWGLALGLFTVGLYAYTFTAVKQETFLDNFDEPETTIVPPNAAAN